MTKNYSDVSDLFPLKAVEALLISGKFTTSDHLRDAEGLIIAITVHYCGINPQRAPSINGEPEKYRSKTMRWVNSYEILITKSSCSQNK
jgi:hypothetical protein